VDGRVLILACGTSYHAGLVGKFLIENIARIPCEVDLASEFRYREPVVGAKDLVVAISQSGETLDTFAAVKEATARGARTLAICNVVDSAIARNCQNVLYTHAGPEVGVASTKCFTAQLAALTLLAIHLGRRHGTLDDAAAANLVGELVHIPGKMSETLRALGNLRELARKYMHARDFLFLGRGTNYPIALEGALKLKEISYIHAEGYAAGEMKHGPIALIDDGLPVVVIATKGKGYDKVLSNLAEVRAREGHVIAVATRGDQTIQSHCKDVLWVEDAPALLQPMLTVLPLQLLSYAMAVARGTDVDQPRNLAKSVTVEYPDNRPLAPWSPPSATGHARVFDIFAPTIGVRDINSSNRRQDSALTSTPSVDLKRKSQTWQPRTARNRQLREKPGAIPPRVRGLLCKPAARSPPEARKSCSASSAKGSMWCLACPVALPFPSSTRFTSPRSS
jgi:glucosamine--fructose-6-phosphate aminotransferase (isomerizing)